MALSSAAAQKALIAFQRFGLGPKPGGMARIGRNPLAALRSELNRAGIAQITTPGLPSYATACARAQNDFPLAEDMRRAELNARIDKQRSVEIGFVERLVMFWQNHFSMTVNKSQAVRGTLGQWERQVVRAHVLGRFSNMLRGTLEHPAMISYLDNDDSIGPNSFIGMKWGVGLNENLAREVMELHTLGSGGGYTEADVTAFAQILTGWSYVRKWEADHNQNGGSNANRGQFIFRPTWHQRGNIKLMGKVYAARGLRQGEAVLDDLAAHPATAEHIAFKLVRHFITDRPTPKMVDPLKNEFIRTHGNLKAVALKLIQLPEAWSTPLTKLKTPYENAIAQYRALGVRHDDDEFWSFIEPLRALRNVPWESPSPEGYSDETPTWMNPDAMRIRLDIAQFASWQYARNTRRNIAHLAKMLFDSALTRETAERVAYAGHPNDALTILFSSPEFQRR